MGNCCGKKRRGFSVGQRLAKRGGDGNTEESTTVLSKMKGGRFDSDSTHEAVTQDPDLTERTQERSFNFATIPVAPTQRPSLKPSLIGADEAQKYGYTIRRPTPMVTSTAAPPMESPDAHSGLHSGLRDDHSAMEEKRGAFNNETPSVPLKALTDKSRTKSIKPPSTWEDSKNIDEYGTSKKQTERSEKTEGKDEKKGKQSNKKSEKGPGKQVDKAAEKKEKPEKKEGKSEKSVKKGEGSEATSPVKSVKVVKTKPAEKKEEEKEEAKKEEKSESGESGESEDGGESKSPGSLAPGGEKEAPVSSPSPVS